MRITNVQQVNTTSIPVFLRLRWRLTTIFLMIAIVPIIFVTVLVVRQIEAQNRAQTFRQLESISILKQQQIALWLEAGRVELRSLLVSPEVRTAIQDPDARPREDAVLREVANISNIIDDIFFYDPSGLVMLSSNEALLGRVVSRQVYFDASLQGEVVQPPFFDVSTGSLALIATAPIYVDDALIAIGAIRYNIDELNAIMLERAGLGETGETYLVSSENNYFLTASRFEGYALNRAYTSDGIERALNRESGAGEYNDYRNPPVPVFGYYQWLPALGSGLLTEIDQAEVQAALSQVQLAITVLAVVIAALAALLGLVVTQRITRPLIQIANSAAAIARGKFDQRVQSQQRDEIGVLAAAFNNMTQAVQDRTTQLQAARDEALAAQRIAKENSRLKSEFLATMSHEMRTPMNAIEGFTSIMLNRMGGVEYNAKTERYLAKIQANSQRLLSLINDFLDLSRIESGRMELARMPISPVEMAQKWRENFSVLADNKGLTYEVTVDPNLPATIYGDEEALSKVAVNLIGNAVKFTEKGAIHVKLEKRGTTLALEVRDTGIGIPPHAREFIFDEFRQVDQSSKRKHGGTGLGLAIVQKLTRQMGGTIMLHSEVGVGSTFTALVPLVSEDLPETELVRG